MATQALLTPTATARGSSSFCRNHDVNRRRFLSLRHHNTASSSSRPITSFVIYLDPIGFRSHQLSKSKPKLAILRAADCSTQPSTLPSTSTAGKTVVPDDQFSLAKVSFGVIGLGVGVSLLSYGFGAYFNILPGSEWSALMLTYGFPLAIIGMAFKYAELKPVPCLTYSDALQLRETSATPILAQVRNDVTRYRYGDEQHLDEALKRIFQYGQIILCSVHSYTEGLVIRNIRFKHCFVLNIFSFTWFSFSGGGIARRSAPTLQSIREEVTGDGRYSLVLVFEAKALQLSDFEQRQAKFASFFGPGITAEVGKGENNLYEVRLISNSNAKPSASPL